METNNDDDFAPPISNRKNPLQKLMGLLGKLIKLPFVLIGALKNLILRTKKKSSETEEEGAPSLSPVFIEKPEKKRGGKKVLMLLLVAAVIGGGVYFGKGMLSKKGGEEGGEPGKTLEEKLTETVAPKEKTIPVKAFKISRFNYEDSLNVLGTIKGAMEFKLSFEVPGVISSVNYREGERYEEGALLISLRQDDILLRLKRAQAELNKSETQVSIASDKVKEHEKLFSMGAIPKQTLDKVKLEWDGAKYESEAARLEVKANEAMLEKSNLYAPSAGMIGELKIEEGETVTQNTLLGTHIMTEYVYAEFGIVERDVNKIALGQKARVFIDAYPDKTFEGVIENVAPVVGGTSRTATAKVRIENTERLLLPGMFARIRILLYSKKNTLVVPTDALQGSEGDQHVFVVHPDEGVAEKRALTIGYTRPDYSQVDAGLSEGELVAVSGLEKLEDGTKIRLLETQEAET